MTLQVLFKVHAKLKSLCTYVQQGYVLDFSSDVANLVTVC